MAEEVADGKKPVALIIVADGSEEIELVTISDVLRRAGIEVTIAGLKDDQPCIICARKAKICVDTYLTAILDKCCYDAVILPGGLGGSNSLAEDKRVGDILRRHEFAGKIVAGICAAPIAFASHKISPGATLTSYPGVKDSIVAAGYGYSEEPVCVWKDGDCSTSASIVTSRSPGTAFLFALKLVELLDSSDRAEEVGKALLLPY